KEIWSKNKELQSEEENILTAVKKLTKDKFKTYHKYIAVVQADGDNIGASIKSLYENSPLNERENKLRILQEQLFKFSKAAAKEIDDYKGKAIYIGGDDLLFFAAVKNGSKNILELLSDIDKKFDKYIRNNEDLSSVFDKMKKKPSMSYGISITYYKYPLAEAREQAYKLLEEKAKKHNNGQKNAVAYSVLKHSGTEFSAIHNKNSDFFDIFKTKILNINNEKDLLKSVIHCLDILKPSLFYIIKNERESIKSKIKNLFDNSFDEDIHKKKYKTHIENIQELIVAGLKEIPISFTDEEFNAAIKKIYGSLRFANFLLRKDNE
ncbi:MAG: type III-B CRISPR-associated protein Cas10/Cmr2, partial [Bacteroidota bacterium]|nr:type III-B CRISPR-associated protein Cas10/Cmr2 [Bacteroidota bacterium]